MIRLRNVTREYQSVRAVDGVSLDMARNEFVALTGPSGCGKSTLMHLLGGLDQPTSGEVYVDELPLHTAGDRELTHYRRHKLGIVFQFFNLLPTMNLHENVSLPLLLQGEPIGDVNRRAAEVLALVGLEARAGHFPHQLSGGEQQRTAIGRALIHRPALLLADEPTGNLDSANAAQVMAVLQKIASQAMTTLLVVTHSEEVARTAGRRIRMRDGKIEDEP
jgi:ABC-type lipoprotein export system ATPase subunit